jgi:hypothetical protein
VTLRNASLAPTVFGPSLSGWVAREAARRACKHNANPHCLTMSCNAAGPAANNYRTAPGAGEGWEPYTDGYSTLRRVSSSEVNLGSESTVYQSRALRTRSTSPAGNEQGQNMHSAPYECHQPYTGRQCVFLPIMIISLQGGHTCWAPPVAPRGASFLRRTDG